MSWKTPFLEKRAKNAKTVAEASLKVGDRFHIYASEGSAWWEVKEVKERGVVIELRGKEGHLTMWDNDMVIYPI